MAGLVLDSSATVNITRSKFVKNVRMKGDGGAIMAMNNTTLHIAESTFSRNEAGRSSDPVTEDGGRSRPQARRDTSGYWDLGCGE